MELALTAEGFEGLETSVDALLEALSPTSLIHVLGDEVAPWLATQARVRFSSEGDEASGPWAPLSPATNSYRLHAGFPPVHPINRRTGDMRADIVNTYAIVATGESVTLLKPGPLPANEELKLAHAQLGGPGYPARPVAVVGPADNTAIVAMFSAFIEGAFNG